MLILDGNNLGERHKDLNLKVNAAAAKYVDFQKVKNEPAGSDADYLFKIDLASKYMNIEYIIEVLTSGDTLHIAKALKCTWMFDDDLSNVINVDNLHQNVFPYMSLKMKRKLLNAISVHVKNPDRALAFYKYCADMKLTAIALKFVMSTSDDFKLKFIEEHPEQLRFEKGELKHFIGGSFRLAEAYLATILSESCKIKTISELGYLYSVSDVRFLDMLEKHVKSPSCNSLSLRMSKNILKKHKDRILAKPSLYIKLLNKSLITRYSSQNDAKVYLEAILPKEVTEFWNSGFNNRYNYILSAVPIEEQFQLLRNIFNAKYPEQPFETTLEFHKQQYYNHMTESEKEKWALDHISSQKEILGIGQDYNWYKFVGFDKAFEELKRFIMITTDNNKRGEILNMLVSRAKNQRDLEKLMKYFYERHINEQRYIKENFIDRVTYTHNVFEFDEDCWMALNKLFQNLDLYSMKDYNDCKSDYKVIVLIYSIIHKQDVHEALQLFIRTNTYFYTMKKNTDKISKEQQEMVYQYLFKFYLDKITEVAILPYGNDIKYQLRRYIHFMLDLLFNYDQKKEDIPDEVMNLIKLDWDEYMCHRLLHVRPKETTQNDLLRYLKKDAKLVVANLPTVKKNIEDSYRFHIGQLLRKIKIYFANDISKEYLKFFETLLTSDRLNPKVALAAVYGIFELADSDYKIDFMTKHAPIQAKVNRGEIDEKLLRIQEAICAIALYSRPPVPLSNLLMYVKGDYVPSCLPLFNSYLANLPLPLCIEFIESILKNPLSVQKHGLRLAFVCFDAENLEKLLLHIWKRTKNVSLRFIIYKALFNKIVQEDEYAPTALFQALCTFTAELNQDDDPKLFLLLTAKTLPSHLISDYIHTVWKTISGLPKRFSDQKMPDVIRYIIGNIHSIRQDVTRPIVEEFIQSVFFEIQSRDDSEADLMINKLTLVAKHLTFVPNQDDLDTKLQLINRILQQCLTNFNSVDKDVYPVRNTFYDFIKKISNFSRDCDTLHNEYITVILENILQTLQASWPMEDSYMLVWELRMDIATRKALFTTHGEDEKRAPIRDIIKGFGENIGNIITEYIEKDIYFKTFRNEIQNSLYGKLNTFVEYTGYDIVTEDVLVVMCLGLIVFKTTDLYLFALELVPSDYTGKYDLDYKSVLNEIKELSNLEVRSKMYYKFVNNDFKVRSFLKL